jgi:steroid 5-alpha reductase family enzyme
MGWLIMELPALIIVPLMFLLSGSEMWLHMLLTGMWLLHYIHRTLIFPFLMRTKGKRMPISIVIMAVVFNLINGVLVSSMFWAAPNEHTLLVIVGVLIFAIGMYVNMRSDYYLISLRTSNKDSYQIPKGFLFEKISCPNHFGEILEWAGFACVAWHVGPLLFLIWTAANLIPRALSHHKWYKRYFEEYPTNRKAIMPHIL